MKTAVIFSLCLSFCLPALADKDKDKVAKAELERLRIELDSCKRVSGEQRLRDSLLIDSLTLELQQLTAFRTEFVKDKLLKSAPDMTVACSTMDTISLKAYMQHLQPFSADELVAAQIEKTEAAIALCSEYHSLRDPLSKPLVYADAERCYKRLLAMREEPSMSDAQKNEFYATARVLSKYPFCIKIVQGIVDEAEKKLKNYASSTSPEVKTFCIDMVKSIVDKAKANDPADNPRYKYISDIPYLANRYNTYLVNMLSNPLNISEETQRAIYEIKQLKTE